jgi:type VI secretion system secreted protein Hcp
MPENDIQRHVAAPFKRPLLAGALAAAAIAVPPVAQAADEIHLKLDGIQGEATHKDHKGEIEVLSFSLGFVNPPGGGAGNKPACGQMSLVKTIDTSSPPLIAAVMTGSKIASGILTFRKAGEGQKDYYILRMTDLLVTSITQSDAVGSPNVTEHVSINATKINFEYKPQDDKGGAGASVTFAFDCKTLKAG